MLRRTAVSLLLGSLAEIPARASASLDRIVEPARGCALLLDVRARRVIAKNSSRASGEALLPPGSALKPFVLAALLRHGRLNPEEGFVCSTRLRIGNRQFDCVHPRLATPMHADTALAYSCNGYVARAAERFEPGELGRELQRLGFASRTGLAAEGEAAGRIEILLDREAQRVQALGEAGVFITPLELAHAYVQLALQVNDRVMQPVVAGLEGAVEFGTAQNARVAGVKVAGKTGSTLSAAGNPIAWFSGFMPSRSPEVVVTVMLAGHSGGSDAAPVAAEILAAHKAGRL